MRREFIFFDKDDNVLFRRSDAVSARFVHEELKHTATFPDRSDRPIERGMRVGWLDRNKNLLMFEIRLPTRTLPDGTVSYTAEHICISELMDDVVQDKRCYGVTASSALDSALDGTLWSVGRVEVNPTGTDNFYWIKSWESVIKVRDGWGVRVWPRITFDGIKITGRYLDILSAAGTFRGVRLQLDRNVEQAGVTYDDRNLVTALYGRGKGEAVGTNSAGETTYGRKITFEDVVWKKADGNPADKPAGQLYVEDVNATAMYGRKGRPRFGIVEFDDCEDANELLDLTWKELQKRIVPGVTISMTILNLRDIGYAEQGLGLGDLAHVIIAPFSLRTQARVVQLDEDLLYPENTRPVIGDYMADIAFKLTQAKKAAESGQKIAQAVPSLLQGYIDTAVTGIMSSKTRRETLADGSEMYVTEDGTKAVRFTGAGILLADGKDSTGDWNWRTAITGGGIVADEITSGVLNANLIRLLGSGTSLDGTTLTIKNPNVADSAAVTIGLDGLKMMNNGDIIGGYYKLQDDIVSAVQMLFNPNRPRFSAKVGQVAGVGESATGITLDMDNVWEGFIGPYTFDGVTPVGTTLFSKKMLLLTTEAGSITVQSNGGDINIDSSGGINFSFLGENAAGITRTLSFTAQQLWNLLLSSGALD